MEDMNRGIIGFNCSGLSNILLKQNGILHIVLRIKSGRRYKPNTLNEFNRNLRNVDCESLSVLKMEIHFLQNGILKHPKIQHKKVNPAMHFVWLKMTLLGWTLKLQKRSILFMHHEN